MKLGKRLKHARERRGMTQEQLATAASVNGNTISQASISALEKRDSETTADLFAFARALRINPEWLQTGQPMNDSGLEGDAWKPASAGLEDDEEQLLRDYRNAGDGWKLTIRLWARTPPEDQPQLSKDMNILMTTIFGKAVSDAKVEEANRSSRHGPFPNRLHQRGAEYRKDKK